MHEPESNASTLILKTNGASSLPVAARPNGLQAVPSAVRLDPAHAVALPRLCEVIAAMSSARKFQVLLKLLAQGAAQACGVDRCAIFLWTEDVLVPAMCQFASGIPRPDLWRLFKALGRVRFDTVPAFSLLDAQRQPVLIANPLSGELLPRELAAPFNARSVLLVPLVCGQRRVGVATFDSATPLTAEHSERASALAGPLANAIDGARSIHDIRGRLQATETLLNVARTIGSTLELQEVARRLTREAARAVGADSAGIYLMSAPRTLMPYAAYHMPKELLERLRHEPIVVHDIQALQTRWSDDVPNDVAFEHTLLRKFPAQSIVITPLRAKDAVVGVLVCAWWQTRRRLRVEEIRLMEGIAGQAAMAIVNARLYAKAEQLAIDRERMRVDKVLHDTLSQTLFSVALKIDQCLRRVRRSPQARGLVEAIKRDTGLMMAQVRQLLASLNDEGAGDTFSERLGRLVLEFRELTGIPVMLIEHGDVTVLNTKVRDALLKIFEEGLAHISKHARTSRIEIRVNVVPDMVLFEISDDGVGVPSGDGAGAGLGITHMREWVAALGGRLESSHHRPSGFRLSGSLPLS